MAGSPMNQIRHPSQRMTANRVRLVVLNSPHMMNIDNGLQRYPPLAQQQQLLAWSKVLLLPRYHS